MKRAMKIVLQPRETMKRRRAKDQLAIDANKIEDCVKNHPGIRSITAIAAQTGLTAARVNQVIKRINAEEVGGPRLDYGWAKPTGGPNAGRLVRGWFQMNRKPHHVAMDHADEHSAQVELGVRRSRLMRLMQAQNLPRVDQATVERMEKRLGVSVEAMTERDLEAFQELLAEEPAA